MKAAMLLMMAAMSCLGQQEEGARVAPKYYRLDFVVKELEAGKVLNSKNYSIVGSTTNGGSTMFRSGDKVAVQTGNAGQFSYLDVGINIDCRLQSETPGKELTMQITADISSISNDKAISPTVSQTKWNSNVVVPEKKAYTVFSSESAASKRTTQLEVTVTPLPQ